MGRSASPRQQLERVAHALRPHRPPYYLHTPDGPDEPAAGWYIVLGDRPRFLGANMLDAYDRLITLTESLEPARQAPARDGVAGVGAPAKRSPEG